MKDFTPSRLALLLSFMFLFSMGYAQKKGKDTEKKESSKPAKAAKEPTPGKIAPDNFSPEQLQAVIVTKINAARKAKGLDTLRLNEILNKAGADQADYMSKKEEATTAGSGKKSTTGKRVAFYGGSESAEELVAVQPISKGKDYFSYDEVASIVVDKWLKGKITSLTIMNNTYIYVGSGISLEPVSKKAYVSVVFGSFNTFNIGPEKRNELPVPYTTKKFRLKPVDDKECKACAKFADMDKLQKGLYVKDDKVYFKYPSVKVLNKLLKNKRDGLAVDIIQKAQYPCAPYNIYDTKLISKGILLKRKWSKKIFKKNLIKDPKNKGLEVELGKFPKGLEGEYEMNLYVIQNKHVCKVLTRKYVEDGGMQSFTPLEVLPDTVKRDQLKYKPVAEVKTLTFNIPFDKNKSTYATEDIIPFIESLNEPDFTIDQILISAYSSIEGDSIGNAVLQKNRAESIMNALVKLQKKEVVKDIVTSDQWEMFKKQVQGTKYAPLALMSKSDARKAINGSPLMRELEEPVLSKERYAEIKLTVTYDITGKKEQAYVQRSLKKAIEKKDGALALNIQQYMIVQVLEGKYTPESVTEASIPTEAPYASLLVNKVWLDKFIKKDTLSATMAARFNEIAKVAPKSEYALYNSVLSNVKLAPLGKDKALDSVQTKIQDLYTTSLNKDRIDALNLEYQFKIIDALDPVEGAKPIVQKSIDRIRGIYKIEGSSWQNALKLAYIFIKNNDYEFSMKILEPFVGSETIDENLLFTYISLCSYYPDKMNSTKFVGLMRKAKDMNSKRYCKLFGAPYLTFQILDNPFIKEDYCKTCDSAVHVSEASDKDKKGKKSKK